MAATSTPFSAANLAAAGMATPAWALLAGAASTAAAAGAASTAGAASPALAAVSILAINWPETTVAPSCSTISTITPACGAGNSNTTLSVSKSMMFSSRATASPTFLCQVIKVASDTLSGNTGTVTSIIDILHSPNQVWPPSGLKLGD